MDQARLYDKEDPSVKTMLELFNKFDKNGDSMLEKSELLDLLKHIF